MSYYAMNGMTQISTADMMRYLSLVTKYRGATGSKDQCDLIIILSLDLSIIPSYFDLMHLNLIIYTLIQINYFLPSKRDNKCCLLVVLSSTILNRIETHYNEFTIVYSTNVYLLEIPIFVDL